MKNYKLLGSLVVATAVFSGCDGKTNKYDVNRKGITITNDSMQTNRRHLRTADSSNNINFGQSVGISQNYAIIGVSESEKAYIFNINSQDINSSQIELSIIEGEDLFGYSVAISDSYALVGAPGVDNNTGIAYLFELNAGDINGSYKKLTLNNEQSGDEFGYSVAINDKYAIVGSPRENKYGLSYVFELNATDINSSQQEIKANENIANGFGKALALNEYNLVVGAPNETSDKGEAYLFDLKALNSGTAIGNLSSGNGQFGSAVAINENYILIGSTATGAKLYELNNLANAPKTFSGDTGSSFGSSVALNDKFAIVGDKGKSDSNGSVYLYKLSDTGIDAYNKLESKNIVERNYFGHSLSVSGANLIVSEIGSNNIREASLFRFDKLDLSFVIPNRWNMISVPMDSNVTASDITGATIWTYDNNVSNWLQPETLTSSVGYWLYTTNKTNYDSIPIVSTDGVTSFLEGDLNNSIGKWYFAGLSGYKLDNNGTSISTLQFMTQFGLLASMKKLCSVYIFTYDAENNTWNTNTHISPYGAMFFKIDNCVDYALES